MIPTYRHHQRQRSQRSQTGDGGNRRRTLPKANHLMTNRMKEDMRKEEQQEELIIKISNNEKRKVDIDIDTSEKRIENDSTKNGNVLRRNHQRNPKRSTSGQASSKRQITTTPSGCTENSLKTSRRKREKKLKKQELKLRPELKLKLKLKKPKNRLTKLVSRETNGRGETHPNTSTHRQPHTSLHPFKGHYPSENQEG